MEKGFLVNVQWLSPFNFLDMQMEALFSVDT